MLLVFGRLGVTSFGGPIAHLGYFREAFVERRRWLTDEAYADLVALCQVLPGPASSQVGMAIGLRRAGGLGLLAAWLGFTAPSGVLMVAFALGADSLVAALGTGWLVGLKAAAVAVVAHAVLGMARTLTPDARRATIAVGALVAVLLLPGPLTQLAVILGGAAAGLAWVRSEPVTSDGVPSVVRVPRVVALGCLATFGVLLLTLPLLAAVSDSGAVGTVDRFYRAGALVFGGGHVVLPLLHADLVLPGLVSDDVFLAGYGAAQAVPGPLFTFAGYLGAASTGVPTGVAGGALALVAIFLPAALLVVGCLPFWELLRTRPRARSALAGVNAAVVGILAAALYTPVFTDGVVGPATLALAAVAFVALSSWRAPAWAVVLGAAVLGGLVA